MSLSRATTLILLLGALSCKKEAPPAESAPAPAAAATAPVPAVPKYEPRVNVTVTENGFEPKRIAAKAGQPLTMVITRKTEKTCATEILFKGQEGKTELPLNKPVEVVYTPKATGDVRFGCAMGMMVGGVLAVTD